MQGCTGHQVSSLSGKSVPDHESGELCNGEVVLGREAAVLRGEM